MWALRMLELIIAVLVIGGIGTLIAKRLRREAIAHWQGEGIRQDLTFAEAALLLRRSPGTIVALLFQALERQGKVRLLAERPPAMAWTGPAPTDPVEKAFRQALDEEGHLRPEGTIALLEAIYAATDEKMAEFSGASTATWFEEEAQARWDRARESGEATEDVVPWLMLLEPGPEWDLLGSGERWDEVKRMLRLEGRFEEAVGGMREIEDAARRAVDGFFALRRDLVNDRPPVDTDIARRIGRN